MTKLISHVAISRSSFRLLHLPFPDAFPDASSRLIPIPQETQDWGFLVTKPIPKAPDTQWKLGQWLCMRAWPRQGSNCVSRLQGPKNRNRRPVVADATFGAQLVYTLRFQV